MEPGTTTTIGAIIAKLLGPTAGTFLALVVIPPRSVGEFLSRASASFVSGIIFAPIVSDYLKWDQTFERTVIGGTVAAFLSWWLLGGAIRIVRARIDAKADEN